MRTILEKTVHKVVRVTRHGFDERSRAYWSFLKDIDGATEQLEQDNGLTDENYRAKAACYVYRDLIATTPL